MNWLWLRLLIIGFLINGCFGALSYVSCITGELVPALWLLAPILGIVWAGYLLWYGTQIKKVSLLFLIHGGTALVLVAVGYALPSELYPNSFFHPAGVYLLSVLPYTLCFLVVGGIAGLVMLIRKAVYMVRKKRGGKNAED